MKKLILLLATCSITITAFSQKARVYEHLDLGFAFGEGASLPSISYTQTLAIGSKFGLRFNSGIRYTQYRIKSGTELENTVSSKDRSILFNNNVNSSNFNIPIGVEIGNRIIAVGINADLIGLSLRTVREGSVFEVQNGEKPEGVSIAPQGLNFLINQNGTLNSQVYFSVTPNQGFSIRGGMAYTQASFNTSYINDDVTTDQKWDSFVERAIRPFVALRFNFEK